MCVGGGVRETHAGAKLAVLLLELGDANFEVRELRFSPVAGVLGSDAVTVCTSLLALFGGEL